jgi:hypothetical protein
MAFDPDAYLAKKQSATFDPDAYLKSRGMPAAPVGPREMGIGEQLMNNPLTKGAVGLGEAALGLGTGLATQVSGGLSGLATTGYNLAKGKSFDEAAGAGADVARNTMNLAYQPRTAEGQVAQHAVMYLPEKATEGWRKIGGEVGEVVGGEKGRIAGEELGGAGMQSLMAVAPVPKMLKQARAAAVAPVDAAATYPGRQTASQIKQAADNAASVEAAKAAQRHGVALDLTQLDKSTALRNIAGPKKTQEAMSAVNAGKPEMALKQAVGIAPEESLSLDTISRRREALAGPKNEIVGMDGFLDDGTAVSQIRGLVPERTVGMGAEHSAAVRRVNEIVKDINDGNGSGSWVMSSIESLRKAARDIFNRDEITPELRNTADIYKGTADALEGVIERRLATENPQLLNDYRANRQQMAQTYLLEDILDNNTGKVSLDKLAKQTANDSGVTGAFRDFGKIYANSPESFKPLPKEAWATRITRTTIPGAIGSVLGTMVAPGAGTLAGMAGGAYLGRYLGNRAATRLASPEYQAKYTALRGDPSRTALGYGEAPAPLSLAADTSPMGGMGGTQVPLSPRPMLDVGMAESPKGMSLRDRDNARWREYEGLDYEIDPRLNPLYQRGGIDYGPELPPVAREQGMLPPELPPVLPEGATPRQGLPTLPDELMGMDEMSLKAQALRDRTVPPTETPLPQLPSREPLDVGFAEVPSPVAKLRERHDVPTTEFPLRQEVLQQPEIAGAIDDFRSQITELEALRDKQTGFWKQKTQSQIDALKQEFAAGMRQLGADTPQQAIGLQPLYEGGGVPKLSIEKSKALRDFQ